MIDFSSLESLFLLVGILIVPAMVIFGVLTYFRVRNSRFHHHHRARRRSSENED